MKAAKQAHEAEIESIKENKNKIIRRNKKEKQIK